MKPSLHLLTGPASHGAQAPGATAPAPGRRRALQLGAGAVAGLALVRLAGAQTPAGALRLGVLPNVSARVVFANYQPVRQHLEAELAQAVEIQTATDFKAFQARTRANEFDVVVTAANLARVVQVDNRWVPFAVYDPQIPGVLVRSKSTPSGGPLALRGRKLALSNPQSLVALRGFAWLASQGLQKDLDYTAFQARNDDSLGSLLSSPDTPYAIMSLGEFRAIPDVTRAGLEIETEFARVPGFVVMHGPAVAPDRAARVQAAFLKLGETTAGKQFFELSGVRAVRAPLAGELEALDPFVAATRSALAL